LPLQAVLSQPEMRFASKPLLRCAQLNFHRGHPCPGKWPSPFWNNFHFVTLARIHFWNVRKNCILKKNFFYPYCLKSNKKAVSSHGYLTNKFFKISFVHGRPIEKKSFLYLTNKSFLYIKKEKFDGGYCLIAMSTGFIFILKICCRKKLLKISRYNKVYEKFNANFTGSLLTQTQFSFIRTKK
jgi:hypothetical protein